MVDLPLQWNADNTVAGAFQALTGLIKAASSDNVQPLVLMACEKLGSSLAISDQTTRRVRLHSIESPSPPMLTFLKGKIGFYKNDCANQLATSQAGVKFLALAIAMVTTMDPYTGAHALELMLRDDKQPADETPPLPQLKDLLAVLESRAEQCPFTHSVLQYQQLVEHQLSQRSPHGGSGLLVKSAPSPELVAGLVKVLREVHRLGDNDITGATIRVGASAPWVIAFVNWCLDVPPSVSLEGDETAFLEQSATASLINVVISSDDIRRPVEATIHYRTKDITKLLGKFSGKTLNYMLLINDYVDWLLGDLGFKRYGDKDFNKRQIRLLREVLGFAIPTILLSVRCGEYGRLGQIPNLGRWVPSLKNATRDLYCSPLPEAEVISKSCSMFLQGSKIDLDFPSSDSDLTMTVSDLPLVKDHLKSLEKDCNCKICFKLTHRPSQEAVGEEWCLKNQFFRSLSFLITDIFAFSLYNCDKFLRVQKTVARDKNAREFQKIIADFLKTGTSTKVSVNPMDLLDWARNLVGHAGTGIEKQGLIMTYKRGQVIYPALFESLQVSRQGYLQLIALKGTLKFNNLPYDKVSSPSFPAPVERRGDPAGFPRDGHVLEPRNLLDTFEFSWDVTPQDGREIHVYMMIHEKKGELIFKRDPLILLQSFANTLIMGNCPHGSDDELVAEDRYCSYSVPWDDHSKALASTSKVNAIAVAGCEELRCFSLAATDFKFARVLRRDSCLECCLSTCRGNGIHILIL